MSSATVLSPSVVDGLPPGPKLPKLLSSALVWTAPQRIERWAHRRYGSMFTLYAAPSGWMVFITEREHLKQVFGGDPKVYHAGEANSIMRGVLGDSSVLLLDEETHRDRRRLMMPPFHRDAVRRQMDVMAEITAENVARWPVGRPFPVAPLMSEITLEVILRTVIGADDPTRLAALRAALPKVMDMNLLGVTAMLYPELQRYRPWHGVRRDRAEADRLLYQEIADRRADPRLAERTDVLAMLVAAADENGRGMTDRELRDQLITLLGAGHETTATGLSWTFERLIRHPDLLRRAVEAAQADDGSGDEFLDAVVKESLRVRPVVYEVGRTLTEPVELGGYRLPAGTVVLPSIGLPHVDPGRYTDPERFDPDRMLGGTPGPTTWLPFGGGGRRCLGATFALIEMRVVIREILRRVRLDTTTAPGERQVTKHVTLVPHKGARIRVSTVTSAPAGA
ncbi:cytochrome P450 [Pseudonocardia eucalypti]|uniref:Cytochrome P450 n=1 Tax=Pseudonocardia eucalypti TaxID=648755 RepID=A0ABP9R1B2_9PSEU|nr:cytochrome P450 [Pseudonocardia eucalypti]